MCGINGFTFEDKELIEKMNESIKHRGPDGSGVFLSEGISLGHNRLSIIDLRAIADQPMHTEEGRYVIVFNGEIYNYRELKKELTDYTFQTTSDTEVILAAYGKWGKTCVEKFNGIFAFAIWDNETRELFLARDHFGVKPLFYYLDDEKLIFSSEIKAILEHDIKKEINKEALNTYFRLLYANGPETIWQNIFKLPPASYAIYKDKKLEISRYWQIDDFSNTEDSKEEIKKQVKNLLTKSVERQMIADVPVGVFLSGGFDSTIMLGLAREQSDKQLKTFSIGFEVKHGEERFNQDFESARKTAKHFGSEHFDVKLREEDVVNNLEKAVWHMDDLVSNPTQIATLILSQMASREVKVVIGGDGGDELFGGYTRYYYYSLIAKWQKIPAPLRSNWLNGQIVKLFGKEDLLDRLNSSEIDLFWSFMARKEKLLDKILKNNYKDLGVAKNYFANNLEKNAVPIGGEVDLTKRMMQTDINTWLLDFSLTGTDKMTMANGLEQRVPFLDKDLAEYTARIPMRFKINSSKQGKKILKEAMADYIPEHIRNQKKAGWFVPISQWLRSGLKGFAYEILSEDYNDKKTNEIIDFEQAMTMLDRHISGEQYALDEIWSLLVFQVWFKKFVK